MARTERRLASGLFRSNARRVKGLVQAATFDLPAQLDVNPTNVGGGLTTRKAGQLVRAAQFKDVTVNVGTGRPPIQPPGGNGVTMDPFSFGDQTTQGIDIGGLLTGIGNLATGLTGRGGGITTRNLLGSGCQFLPPGAKQLCEALTRNGSSGLEQLQAGCPSGTIKVGTQCIAPGDAFPGGDPLTQQAGGVATTGAFGMPALSPTAQQRVTRKCRRGFVLGIDNLCYPKAVLPGRSQFRKWRRQVRPPVTRRDVVAIRRAASAKNRVLELAKDVGLHATKTKPSSRKK